MKTCWPLTILFAAVLIYIILQGIIMKLLKPCIFRKGVQNKTNLNYHETKQIWRYNDYMDYDFRRNKKYLTISKAVNTNLPEQKK